MPVLAEAQHAIWSLNGTQLKGIRVTVSRFSSMPA